jgi:hypothetical protein
MLPAAERLPEARSLAEGGRYFLVHAPRQTGKTTAMNSLAEEVNAGGRRVALQISCEVGEPWGDDIAAVELALLDTIRVAARVFLPAEFRPPDPWPDAPPGTRLSDGLMDWAVTCPLPIVLILDEIDALRGRSLISVLRQLRNGFSFKAQAFPDSVVLCGLRDIRDYKAASGGDPSRLGTASPFNVMVESLRIRNFSHDEVAALYAQHTGDTGQEFTPEAVERAFALTQGQPWLVNAIAYEIIDKMGVAPPVPITVEHVEAAKERLVLARATHLYSLSARLREPRVRRVIEPLLAGTYPGSDLEFDEDVQYVQDLGLIAQGSTLQVANPIYREVIVRQLGAGMQRNFTPVNPQRFVLPDGRLDFPKMLHAFIEIWPEHEEILAGFDYPKAAFQVMFMMFLQRVVNGGGMIDREYGIGRGRIDLLVRKPYGDGLLQREAVELKVWHPGRPDPLNDGLAQLDRYLDRLSLDTGTLVIFDRRPAATPVHERTVLTKEQTPSGRTITLLRA